MTRTLAQMLAVVTAFSSLAVAGARAQTVGEPHEHDFTSCSIFGAQAGVSTTASQAGAMFGGMVGWPLRPRLGLEVEAAWSDRPDNGSAFMAGLALRQNLTARRTVVPFVKAGVGISVAQFDTARALPPDFFRRRLGHGTGSASSETFTDPGVIFGGGVSWFVGRRLAVRPEVQTMLLLADSRTSASTSVSVRVEYHFEAYRITPDRAR